MSELTALTKLSNSNQALPCVLGETSLASSAWRQVSHSLSRVFYLFLFIYLCLFETGFSLCSPRPSQNDPELGIPLFYSLQTLGNWRAEILRLA